MRALFAAMLFVIGCGAIEQTPAHCQADLASAPADMSAVSPDLTTLPTGAGPGARCHVEADCDGIATAERYCATDVVYEPDGSEGYCLEAIQTAAGAYHIYFGDPRLTGRDAGEAYCDMTGLPVNLLPPGTFVCGTFSIQ